MQLLARSRSPHNLLKWRSLEDAPVASAHQGIPLSRDSAYHLLQECNRTKDLEYGRYLQSLVIESGLASIAILGNYLIRLFAACGCLVEANQTFRSVSEPNVYTWSSIISAHANSIQSASALELYTRMQQSYIDSDRHVFLSVLKACSMVSTLHHGRYVHYQMIEKGLQLDVVLGSVFVDMYAKCGSLQESCKVFHQISDRDVVCWGAMISGYAQHGEGFLAIGWFEKMQQEGISPDKISFLSILKACSMVGALEWGRLVHNQVSTHGFELDVIVGTALVDMYVKCGSFVESCNVFYKIPNKGPVTWNVLITGYCQHNEGLLALECFGNMRKAGLTPDKITLSGILKASASIEALDLCRLTHAEVLKLGHESDTIIASALVDTYAKCGSLQESCKVFSRLSNRDIISWSVMIAGYSQCGKSILALDCLEEMQNKGIKPNTITFLSSLKACASMQKIEHGRLIHEQILSFGFESDLSIGSTLIDMYAKCGSLDESCQVFTKLTKKDVVSWGTMIAAYAEHEEGLLALEWFDGMQRIGIKPDRAIYLSVLKACGIVGAIDLGRTIQDQIMKSELEFDVMLGSSLVDMYAKCGSLEESRKVFCGLHKPVLVSWNALLAGYAQHGEGQLALDCFKKMQAQGIKPDKVTFLSILVACNHSGLAHKGPWYFGHISEHHGLTIEMEHYLCLVDLLGRSGYIGEAEDLLQMIEHPTIFGWKSLLNSCRMHGNVELGNHCFKEVMRLGPHGSPGYVLMSNLYADALFAR